jgi:uncharacterized Zn finger protein
MEPDPKNKKPYSPPAVTKLTPQQAKNLVVERKNYSEEEAAEFLKSLRKRLEEKKNKQSPSPGEDQNQERSA